MSDVEKAYWSMLAAYEWWGEHCNIGEAIIAAAAFQRSAITLAQLSTVSPTQKVRPV